MHHHLDKNKEQLDSTSVSVATSALCPVCAVSSTRSGRTLNIFVCLSNVDGVLCLVSAPLLKRLWIEESAK